MNTADNLSVQNGTEEQKQTAMADTKKVKDNEPPKDETIHTINPFTGTQVAITPDDLEGIEKLNEANTGRD